MLNPGRVVTQGCVSFHFTNPLHRPPAIWWILYSPRWNRAGRTRRRRAADDDNAFKMMPYGPEFDIQCNGPSLPGRSLRSSGQMASLSAPVVEVP